MSEPTAEQVADIQARHSSFVAAFFALQRELPEIKKSSEADAGTRGIMHYANLKTVTDAVMPLLGKHGFIWSCQPMVDDGRALLRYELTHVSHTEENPQQRVGFYPIFGDNAPQKLGAAITYARRYALGAVLGLTPENEEDAEGKPAGRVYAGKKAAAKPAPPKDPDMVPGVPLPGENPERITQQQTKALFALLRELGVSEAKRHDTVNKVLEQAGHPPIASFTDLTVTTGKAVYDALKKEKDLRTNGSEEPA